MPGVEGVATRRSALIGFASGFVVRRRAWASPSFDAYAGKASNRIRFERPKEWTTAVDRVYDADASVSYGGNTISLIGNFKSVDTIAVRVERASRTAMEAGKRGDATGVAEALTAAERDAVANGGLVGVIGGVEGGQTGTIGFDLDPTVTMREDGVSGRRYFTYAYETKVCRGSIDEEGLGGTRTCVGPKGDVLPIIERKNACVVTFVGDRVVKLHASAVTSRFNEPEVQEIMNRAVETFTLDVV
jgi:hypothetical protein